MNIIRITRHSATAPQIADLLRIFGDDCVITEMDEQFPADQREAVARFDVLAAEADAVEAVLPLTLMQAILTHSTFAKRGGKLIRADMRSDRAGGFYFIGYERIIEIRIVIDRM